VTQDTSAARLPPEVDNASHYAFSILNRITAFAALTYVLGFLIAAPFYEQFGVPIDALTTQRYLFAGVAFAFLTIMPGYAGYRFAVAPNKEHRAWVVLATLGIFVIVDATTLQLATWTQRLAFLGYALLAAAMGYKWKPRPTVDRTPFGDFVLACVAAVVATGAFGRTIYPLLPAHFGGPDIHAVRDHSISQKLSSAWLAHLVPADADQAAWAKAILADPNAQPKYQRAAHHILDDKTPFITVYTVLETASDVYVTAVLPDRKQDGVSCLTGGFECIYGKRVVDLRVRRDAINEARLLDEPAGVKEAPNGTR
jgi:hypothetical protein